MTRSYVRCAIYLISLLAAAVAALMQPGVAVADDRVYLTRSDIELGLIGKVVLSKNLSSGTLSHWEFRPDGTVEASRTGLGKAAGTWVIHDDGRMCVTMVNRTVCRYWFRVSNSIANADTMSPDAPVVAEIRFE